MDRILSRRTLFCAALLVFCPWIASASGGGGATGDDEWTIDDLVLAERVTELAVEPDGGRAVWVLSTVAKVEDEEKRVSSLWLASLDEPGEPVRLTRGPHHDSRPRFAPDGRKLAFLSDRDLPPGTKVPKEARTQVWLLPLQGGEPYPAATFDRSVRDAAWIDAKTLLVLAQESPTVREKTLDDEKKDTSVVVEDAEHEPPVRLFRVDLDGEVRRLTENADWIDRMAVSPDGRRALVSAQQSLTWEFDSRVPPHTYLVDLGSGERTRLFDGTDLLPGGVAWEADGSGFYFTNSRSNHPLYRTATVEELWHYDLESGATEEVELDWVPGLGGGFVPLADGVLVLLDEGVRYRPARYVRGDGDFKRQDVEATHARNVDGWEASRDGARIVYQTSAVDRPVELWTARLDGARLVDERPLVKLDEKRFAKKPRGRYEVLHWAGARGEEVEGILQYPLDWVEGERRPLLLDIHGGPLGADRDTWYQGWAAPNILWRQRGAFVLQVNYHGSSGYGLDWAESIEKHYYELEIPDIQAGVDLVIERGLADPDRLGSIGWSNGGILTAELITRDPRYKAASVGAADVEWASDWANVDFGASFDNYYFGATPWEDPQLYVDKSPFYRLEDVTTPTIVHTGTEDTNVPPHQSWSLFRAMKFIGKTPVRLVIYPGEPHGLRKTAHQRRKIAEDLAWFDEHLFATLERGNAAIKEGSLLASLLERAGAARHGGVLGREAGGVLVPETVSYEGLEVGRFEVTRAQWAAFDAGFELAPGEGDLPVVGVSFDRAKDYAAWLAEKTGRPFRLPSEDEAKRLAKAAGKGGNTLDRWAGYTPNPEDAARLALALSKLPEGALLLPAGSLPGKGEPAVYDLDGNAAEWAVAADGSGAAAGPSAERSTDARGSAAADPAYTGLRIVAGR